MVSSSSAKDHVAEYLTASALAAAINYPLWRLSAMGQSGFVLTTEASMRSAATSSISTTPQTQLPHSIRLVVHAFSPPYKGAVATVLGMTWARAAIFWGSDVGHTYLSTHGYSSTTSTLLPPLLISTAVQCINMPLVRATITIQDPSSQIRTVSESLRHIAATHGIQGLWHGVSAGILKSVPKYCVAIYVKNVMERQLPSVEEWRRRRRMRRSQFSDDGSTRQWTDDQLRLVRSAIKSVVAGMAGAVLTNPVDVIRNEMFKTNQPLMRTVRNLSTEVGWYQLCTRGLAKNVVAVSIPVACTIFFTDALVQLQFMSMMSS